MIEDIYRTIQGILYYKLPKNRKGQVVVGGRRVVGWYTGDREVHGDIPAIELQARTTDFKKLASGTVRAEHQISIKAYIRASVTDVSESDMQEMTRLIYMALLPHRLLWLMPPCPICSKDALTPLHFSNDHTAIAAPFLTAAQVAFATLWTETHPGGEPLMGLTDSGVAAVAWQLLWDAVRQGDPVTGLDDTPRQRIQSAINENVPPVRWLYNGECSKIDYAFVGEGQQLLRGGQFTLTYQENIAQPAIGPDDVPTTALTPDYGG